MATVFPVRFIFGHLTTEHAKIFLVNGRHKFLRHLVVDKEQNGS